MTAATVRDPVCGMSGQSRDLEASLRPSRRDLPFLLRPAAAPNSPPIPRKYLDRSRPHGAAARAGRHDLHLPDASGDPPGRSGKLPDLRHGAGARGGEPRCGAQSRTRRHDAALLDRRRAALPAVVLEMGGHLAGGHGLIDPALSNWIQLVFATPVVLWAGWPFFVRGWQSLRHAQSQHVHADRDGHRRGLCLQRGRHRSRRRSSRPPSAAMAARSRSISRRRPSSPCWCCSARCWSCARARRPRARSRRCCGLRRRPRAASATTAATMRSRSTH